MAVFSGWSDFPGPVLAADLTPVGEGRTPGLHLSDIIKAMRVAEGKEDTGEIDPGLSQLGFVWETALEYVAGGMGLDEALDLAWKRTAMRLRQGIAKQVRLERDGIHMTPDGFVESAGEVESYKATATSLAHSLTQDGFESAHWEWIVQEQAYCLALGVDTARWIVLWRAGDYSKGVGGTMPRVLQATMTWEPTELHANWERVLKVRDQIGTP